MDVRLLEQADIPQAKALWSEAFGDTAAYIDWYFANKVTPGNSLGMFDGRLVSVVHMIPLDICVQGRPLKSSYIAGAATAADRRGEGLMRTLLYESLRLMKQRGIAMTHLYPFKHSFYENFGWATYSYVQTKRAEKGIEQHGGEIIESCGPETLAPLYKRMMSGFDGYVIRGEREWRWRLEEHMTDGGKAAALLRDGRPTAYMLYSSVQGKANVIETVYTGERDIQALLAHILANGNKSAEYFIPADKSAGATPYGMARIVDARALLKMFSAEDVLERVRITDDYAEWNNTGSGQTLSVLELAKIVHRGPRPDREDGKNDLIYNILMKHFLFRSTCIFEQY